MRRSSCVTVVGLCAAACLGLPPVRAAEIVVRPDPAGQPVLQQAIAAAPAGSTIRVRKGLYRERVVIDRPLSLVGEEGAVLDPSEPFAPQWAPAPDLGAGVYRAPCERRPRALFLDGKVLAEIDERRTQKPGPWFWKTLVTSGPPLSGFEFIRAIWIYRSDEKAITLHLENDGSPAGRAWSAIFSTDPVVSFRKVEGASVRGLTLAHGYVGASLGEGAVRCTVAGCTVGPFEKTGIALRDGASGCLVEKNEVFRGSFEEWAPRDESKRRYEVWQVHKLAGFYDRVGIDLFRAGADNRIHANHVYETFDGIDLGDYAIESLDKPLVHPEDGKGTEIWENVIENTRDSGIELGAGCIDVKVHHNVLRRTHGGLRYKLPRIGPVFIYRNVLVDSAPFDIWYSMDDSPAEGYVYHNTIIGGSAGLIYSSMPHPHKTGAPRWHYLNNLVCARNGFFSVWRTPIPVNFTADYNVVAGGGKPWPDDPTKDSHSRYLPIPEDAAAGAPDRIERLAGPLKLSPGFPPKPLPGSPAIDAGLDLSTYYHGKPLPGCEPGYFKGKAPDAGAYEAE